MREYIKKIGKKAKIAFKSKINNKIKNKVLKDYCKLIIKNKNKIIDENKKDIQVAEKKKLKENLIKRLSLNNIKIESIIKSIRTISNFKDPIDQEIEKWIRPNGLKIKKVTIPIGVIGIIYESRPNVTADVSTLRDNRLIKFSFNFFFSANLMSFLFSLIILFLFFIISL